MTEYDVLLAASAGYDLNCSDDETDEELKEAFAAGLLKPGLNIVWEAPEKKVAKNYVAAMKQKLAEMQKNLPLVKNYRFNVEFVDGFSLLGRTPRPC